MCRPKLISSISPFYTPCLKSNLDLEFILNTTKRLQMREDDAVSPYGNDQRRQKAKALITKRKFFKREVLSLLRSTVSFCSVFILLLFSSHEIDVLRDSKSPPKLQSPLLSRVAFSIFCGKMNQFSRRL